MRIRLPTPASWQDFEALCHLLWKEIWADPNAQRVGRSGQNQDGLDLVGRPAYWHRFSGIQCKDRDGRLGSHLSEDDLHTALKRAADFSPKLSQFTVATTSPNDASIQAVARTLAAPDGTKGEVYVWSWDEIEAELVCRPKIMEQFFPQYPLNTIPGVLRLPVSAPRDRLQAYFRRPTIARNVDPALISRILQVSYEIADNAFAHGRASTVEVAFDGRELRLTDNGSPFNPWVQLDHRQAKEAGGIGARVVKKFRDDFHANTELAYGRVDDANQISVRFDELPVLRRSEIFDLTIDFGIPFGRSGFEQYADSIPLSVGLKEVVLNFTDDSFMSGVHILIRRVRDRLPEGVKLSISYPRESMIGDLSFMFREGVKFRPR